jgi:formate-dependent nitrite reductase cytochrome c552 subunit
MAFTSNPPDVETQISAPEPCELCHEAEEYQWSFSVHAKSMNAAFMKEWEKQGKKEECLVCHRGTYDAKTGIVTEHSVSCQDCHGPDNPDHPQKAKMVIPVTSDVCRSCHGYTWGQWRVSAHAQNNIQCFDCHKMHQNKLRKGSPKDPDELCGTCHPKRLDDFVHSSHGIKGLTCITCHMPKPEEVFQRFRGTGAPNHIFTVEAKPCANCHREMVHSGHEIPSLTHEVTQLEGVDTEKLANRAKALTEQTENLKKSLDANKRVLPWIVIITFVIGAFSGSAFLLFFQKRKRQSSSSEEPS